MFLLDKITPRSLDCAASCGELAQWLEQWNHNPLVRGSNP